MMAPGLASALLHPAFLETVSGVRVHLHLQAAWTSCRFLHAVRSSMHRITTAIHRPRMTLLYTLLCSKLQYSIYSWHSGVKMVMSNQLFPAAILATLVAFLLSRLLWVISGDRLRKEFSLNPILASFTLERVYFILLTMRYDMYFPKIIPFPWKVLPSH